MSSKELGTLHSRQRHFIKFLEIKNLGNNVALKGFTVNTRNIIMACYAAHLASGETLLCKSIRSGTILRYLSAAADLSVPANITNPCLDIMGKQSQYIKDIINEVRRWESIPNRREPLTKSMITYIMNKGDSLAKHNPDNIYSALSDWLVIGLQAGFRKREWAQDSSALRKTGDTSHNIDGTSAAFIMDDFEFRNKNNSRLNQDSYNSIRRAPILNIRWRFQKNNDNGQVISYYQNLEDKSFCVLQAGKRIYKRTKKLGVKPNKPIAIFTDIKRNKKVIEYINDVHICKILREAASDLYKISSKEDLAKFTAHSIRVGACVLLHSQNVSAEDIKFRLRWRSDSFRMYLRNIIQLAMKHTDVINKA